MVWGAKISTISCAKHTQLSLFNVVGWSMNKKDTPPNKAGQASRVFTSFALLLRDFANSSAVSNSASADGVASTTPGAGEPFIKSPYTNATRRTTWEKQSNSLDSASKGTVQVLTGPHSWECMHRIYIYLSWYIHPKVNWLGPELAVTVTSFQSPHVLTHRIIERYTVALTMHTHMCKWWICVLC